MHNRFIFGDKRASFSAAEAIALLLENSRRETADGQ